MKIDHSTVFAEQNVDGKQFGENISTVNFINYDRVRFAGENSKPSHVTASRAHPDAERGIHSFAHISSIAGIRKDYPKSTVKLSPS